MSVLCVRVCGCIVYFCGCIVCALIMCQIGSMIPASSACYTVCFAICFWSGDSLGPISVRDAS